MASTSELPTTGIIVFALASVFFAFVLTIYIRDVFGPPIPLAGQRWMIAFALLVMIPLWGGGLSVFWFEALGEALFRTAEARDNVRTTYTIALAALWLIVFARTFFLMVRGVRENPSSIVGGATVILLVLAAYATAVYFFELPVFDFIDASKEAVR